MRFRPCIDIHGGKVKQIVGGSLDDSGAVENFVSVKGAADYAKLYKDMGLTGGHIILLDPSGSEKYEEDLAQAKAALSAYRGGLQIGGGVNDRNAGYFLEWGASHVIVTSYVFKDGKLDETALDRLIACVGREHLVLDLSCRKRDDEYFIVTDRWQKFTDMKLDRDTLAYLSDKCDEMLVHAVDVEGRQQGPDPMAAAILSGMDIPVTYAGGIHSYEDIEVLEKYGVDFTVGSALDIFGGSLSFDELCRRYG